ncbi:DUF2442 domain-containing protein [Sphingomonas sp.]|uniref:DUF2442 domain-containing protein n=1 Tax=Sphingomonas sp. TaxID=28214 RepID=UPI0035C7F9CA
MNISVRATEVTFDTDQMWVCLDDGRTIGVPLAWFPRLLNRSRHELDQVWISPTGLHWDELDEDLSIASLLNGTQTTVTGTRHAA